MGEHEPADGISQVLGLQIGELLLLGADFQIEQVVVDLRDQRFQRHAALHTGGIADHGHDVARIDKGLRRGGRIDGCLLEEARGMPGGGHLLDALSEGIAAADEIGDLALIAVDFNRTRPEEIGSGGEVEEVSFHFLSLRRFKVAVGSNREKAGG